jgi:hypothetical protein
VSILLFTLTLIIASADDGHDRLCYLFYRSCPISYVQHGIVKRELVSLFSLIFSNNPSTRLSVNGSLLFETTLLFHQNRPFIVKRHWDPSKRRSIFTIAIHNISAMASSIEVFLRTYIGNLNTISKVRNHSHGVVLFSLVSSLQSFVTVGLLFF